MKYSVLLAALLAVSMTACGQKEEAAAPEAPAAEVAGEAAIEAGEAAVDASKAAEEAAPPFQFAGTARKKRNWPFSILSTTAAFRALRAASIVMRPVTPS